MANHYGLNNLIVVLDRNQMQSLDFTEKTAKLEPLSDKWAAFNWLVLNVDGHNHDALRDSFVQVQTAKGPSIIIANTIKGKGISFMELNILWHYRFPHLGGEYEAALHELHSAKPSTIDDPYEVKK
jgi:transketolase